jgi:hypothetical protein
MFLQLTIVHPESTAFIPSVAKMGVNEGVHEIGVVGRGVLELHEVLHECGRRCCVEVGS